MKLLLRTSPIALRSQAACLLLWVLVSPGVRAQDFGYNINNGAITITRSQNPTGAVAIVIPSTINGLPVTMLGFSVFFQNYQLLSVTIPRGVTNIQSYCFYRCGITNLSLPDTLVTIGDFTFQQCEGLTSVTIPDNV